MFRENLAQVPLNRARADEQPRGDVLVGQVFADQPDNVGLLGGQFAVGHRGAFAHGPASGLQFAGGALCERFSTGLARKRVSPVERNTMRPPSRR